MKKKGTYGITLIALVVTIVVLLILAAITIKLLVGDNSIFGSAREAKFKDKMAGYRDMANIWVTGKLIEDKSNDMKKYNSGQPLIDYIDMIGEENSDVKKSEVIYDIEEIIPQIEEKDKEKVVVYKGEMYYVKSDKNKNAEKEAKWCTDINIKILELKRPSKTTIIDGSYQFIDGVWVCTPDLKGFDELHTRYVKEANGAMTPGTFIFNDPDKDWYSYGKSKWANIVTENNGNETYFTWIPRYCYKIDANGKKTDVKLIDVKDNSWKDPYIEYYDKEGNEIEGVKPVPWSELEKQGYVIPEAFTFGGKQLAGFWSMKYMIGESLTAEQGGSVISYQMITAGGTIKIKEIKVNKNAPIYKATPITKYTVSLNGYTKFTVEGADVANIGSKEFSFDKKDLKPGEDNVLNVTGLNSKGEMVGSYTTVYSPAQYNEPELGKDLQLSDGTKGAFNKDTTFYVTYDASGNEQSYIPISQDPPADWYDYEESKWANIVTRNNNAETYFTWIPRYQYQIDSTNKKTTVKFIKGTGTTSDEGYFIPEAFTFGGKELTGFWAMKYMIGGTTAAKFDTNVVAGENSIKTSGITGGAAGQTYNYYINGVLKASKTSATNDTVKIEGLEAGKTYTLVVQVINSSSKALLGTIVKQAKTVTINAPDLGKDLRLSDGTKGAFDKNVTFYVTYDAAGKANSSIPISEPPPDNWYDYSSSKWANIVVKGKDASGKATATYFTWIPRYKYKINADNKKTEVEFLKNTDGTSGTTSTDGWTIPEAFKFGGKELKGFWAMKYMIGDKYET